MSILRLAAVIALLIVPITARAQDMLDDYAGPEPSLRAETTLCTEALDLFCREARKPVVQEAPKTGFLVKFSRLAGMFMGRVDAAQTGDFHFRFTLDIKTPPSSTDNHINLDNRAG